MRFTLAAIFSCITLSFLALPAIGQPPDTNYDEAKIPPYELPDPLKMESGEKVTVTGQQVLWGDENDSAQ